MATTKNGISKNWAIIIYCLTTIFACGVFYASVINYGKQIDTLVTVKAEKTTAKANQEKINELCKSKLDKTIFDAHQKRDDERFELLMKQNDKIIDGMVHRLQRIENKVDQLYEKR